MMPLPFLKSLGKKNITVGQGLLRDTQKSENDYKNFPIEKKTRFSNRFFQFITSALSYYFLGSIPATLSSKYDLYSISICIFTLVRLNWFLAITSPIVATCLVASYFIPIIVSNWTSRKILAMELLLDSLITFLWIVCFSIEVQLIGNNCPPGKSSECDMFNWSLAFNILSFLFWFAAVGLDVHAYAVGLGWIKGSRIQDAELDAQIRRMGRL